MSVHTSVHACGDPKLMSAIILNGSPSLLAKGRVSQSNLEAPSEMTDPTNQLALELLCLPHPQSYKWAALPSQHSHGLWRS